MAPPPGPFSGNSTLALVARASFFSVGVVYGSLKLKILKKMDVCVCPTSVVNKGGEDLLML
ncbi:hypothetical protein ACS0TY_003910 [Phlomoides rotata]